MNDVIRVRDDSPLLVRRRQKVRNVAQGFLLLAAMATTATLLAWLLLGPQALPWLATMGVLVALLRPRIPTRWLLSQHGAQLLTPEAAPRLHRIVLDLAARAGLEKAPDLYYVPSPIPNAFTVGHRADSALAVTDGLLRILDDRELVGVLAHELSHIRNGDTTLMWISDLISRMAATLATLGAWSVLLALPMSVGLGATPLLISAAFVTIPTLLALMQLAFSRSREYDADLDGAWLTGDPEGLARGLLALEQAEGRAPMHLLGPVPPTRVPVLLRTHPSTTDRVRRLRELTPMTPLAGRR